MLGDKIKELRIKNGMTQKELGKKLGFSDNTITNYEKNKRDPDYDTLVKLANIFDVSISYLLDINEFSAHALAGFEAVRTRIKDESREEYEQRILNEVVNYEKAIKVVASENNIPSEVLEEQIKILRKIYEKKD